MGIDNFWQQPNERRFKLNTGTPDNMNLDNLSRQFGIAKNQLKSIFDRNDLNHNGVLEDEERVEGNELENFLTDVNAEFTHFDPVSKNKTIKYKTPEGYEVTEVYNSLNELIEEKIIIISENTPPLKPDIIEQYTKYENGKTVYVSTKKNNEIVMEGKVEYKDNLPSKRIILSPTEERITTFRNGFEAEDSVYEISDEGKKITQKAVYEEDGSIIIYAMSTDGNAVKKIQDPDGKDTIYVYEGDDLQKCIDGEAKIQKEFVIINKNNKVSEEDIYNYSDEGRKLVQKVIHQEDGTEKTFTINDDNNTLETITTPEGNGKAYLYEGDDIQKCAENSHLYEGNDVPLSKEEDVKLLVEYKLENNLVVNEVEYKYDDEGNCYTKIYAHQGDGWPLLADLFNTDEKTLAKLNKRKYPLAGEPYWMPGMHRINEKALKGRYLKDSANSRWVTEKHLHEKAEDIIYSSQTIEYELPDDFNNAKDLANFIAVTWNRVALDDNFEAGVAELTLQLKKLNGEDFEYKKGAKVRVVGKRLSEEEKNSLKDLGFEPNDENWLFYMRFNSLSPKQKDNIMQVLKYCKENNITDKEEINATIIRYYPHLQLFETDEAKLNQPTRGEMRAFLADLMIYQLLDAIQMFNAMVNENNVDNLSTDFLNKDFVFYNLDRYFTTGLMSFQNLFTAIGINDNSAWAYKEKLTSMIEKCLKLRQIATKELQNADESFSVKKQRYCFEAEEEFRKALDEICPHGSQNYDDLKNYYQFIQKKPRPDMIHLIEVPYGQPHDVVVDSEWLKKEEEFKKSFMPDLYRLSNDIESWSGNTSVAGGLITFAAELIILHKVGAMKGVGAQTRSVAAFAQRNNLGIKSTHLLTGITSGAGTATVFSLKPMISTLGKHLGDYIGIQNEESLNEDKANTKQKSKGITGEEMGMITEHWFGLFKFGVFGSIVAGNLGALSEETVLGARNSKFMLQRNILNEVHADEAKFIEKLNEYAAKSKTMGDWTREITNFTSNAAFMAVDEGSGYGEAGENLAQMEMVSKMVAGLLGAKNAQAIPRQNISYVGKVLDKYQVLYRQDGSFLVTTPEGNLHKCKNYKEYLNYTFEVTMMELAKSIEANRQQYAEAHRIENNISNESRQTLEGLREKLPEKVNEEPNGLYRNDEAEFTVEKGKIVKIATKDGREITDPLKIAKYETKYGVDISKLEEVRANIVDINEGKVETTDEKPIEPNNQVIAAALPLPLPRRIVNWLTENSSTPETKPKTEPVSVKTQKDQNNLSLRGQELRPELRESLQSANINIDKAKNMALASESSGVTINLQTMNSEELAAAFEKFVETKGMKSKERFYAFTDDGTCVIKNADGTYEVEVYGNNFFGIKKRLKYNPQGELISFENVSQNNEGYYIKEEVSCKNGQIFNIKSVTANSNGFVCYIEDNFYTNKRNVTYFTENNTETPINVVPDGYILDVNTGNVMKVNVDNIQTEKFGNENGGGIIIKDEFGNELGQVNYQISNGELCFDSLESSVNGIGIGTKLIEQLKIIAKENGYTLSADASFSPIMGGGVYKPASNLKFYYKMGFRAEDPLTDKIVQECIEKGYEIPVSLNNAVRIKYSGDKVVSDNDPQVRYEKPAAQIFESFNDFLNNSDKIGKKFSPVQIEQIKSALEKESERLEALNVLVSVEGLDETTIVRLLSSEKVTTKELLDIKEYKKVADEQGFDLVNMMESSEADFNNYIQNEASRLTGNAAFEVTDNLKYLAEQVSKRLKPGKSVLGLENLKTKEEVKLASEIFAAVKNIEDVDSEAVCKAVKKMSETDLPLAKKWVKAHGLIDERDLLSILDYARKSPAKAQFASDMLDLSIQYNELKQQNPEFQNPYRQGISGYMAMFSMIKNIETVEQEQAVMKIIGSLPLDDLQLLLENEGEVISKYVKTEQDADDYLNFGMNFGEEVNRIYFEIFPHDIRECFYKVKSSINTNPDGMRVFSNIAGCYKNPETSELTAEFLKNNKDTYFINKWNDLVRLQNAGDTQKMLKRTAILDKTGVIYDQDFKEAITSCYRDENTNEITTFFYPEEALQEIADILLREDIKSKLGRTLHFSAAKNFWDIGRKEYAAEITDFVLSHINKNTPYYEVSNVLDKAQYVKTPEQIPLAEFMLGKGHNIKVGQNNINGGMSTTITITDLFKNIRSKEAIERFIKLYNVFPIENKAFGEFVLDVLCNSNDKIFTNGMELYDRCQNLVSTAGEFAFAMFKQADKNGKEVIYAFDELAAEFPELADALKNLDSSQFKDVMEEPEFAKEAANRIRMKAKFFEHIRQTNPEHFKHLQKNLFNVLKSKESIEQMIAKYDYLCSVRSVDKLEKEMQVNYFWGVVSSEVSLKEVQSKLVEYKNANDGNIDVAFDKLLKKEFNESSRLSGDSHAFLNRLRNNAIKLRDGAQLTKDDIVHIQEELNETNIPDKQKAKLQIAKILCFEMNDVFSAEEIIKIINYTNHENTAFAHKLITDRSLGFTPKQIVKILYTFEPKQNGRLAIKLCFDKNSGLQKELIINVLESTHPGYKEDLAIRLCTDKELNFPKELIAGIMYSINRHNIKLAERLCADKKLGFPPDMISDAIKKADRDNLPLAEMLCTDKELNWPKDKIEGILEYTSSKELPLATELCTNKELNFPIEYIPDILKNVKVQTVELATRLCTDKNLNFPPEEIAELLENAKEENLSLVEQLLVTKGLSYDKYADILKSTKINDENDAGGNNGKVDDKKRDKYIRLLQNPRASEWAVDMLNQGWDIDTVSKLNPTKQGFYSAKPETKVETKQVDSDTQFFMDFGLEEKQASAIVKAITINGMIDIKLQQAGVKLIQAGISPEKIGDILNSAQFTGEFNPQVVEDAITIKNLELSQYVDSSLSEKEVKKQLNVIGFAEKYIPLLNNIKDVDVAVKFNAKLKNQLKGVLNGLKPEIKQALADNGFDLSKILKKLDVPIVKTSDKISENAGRGQVNNSEFRKKSSITGFEKIVVDKYNPDESKWRSESECRKWAQEKYDAIADKARPKKGKEDSFEFGFKSVRTGDHVDTENVNLQREAYLREWFDYLESTESGIQDNPFALLLMAEKITENLLPENSVTPDPLDKENVKKVLAETLETGTWSFDKSYTLKMTAAAKQSSGGIEVEINGRKMTWYTVPKTDSSRPDFKTNAAKVRAFSDGTNWCIRTWNAENYVQQGNMHFLVDETGLTQVCIRENYQGNIAEIQKRQQVLQNRVPVPYVEFVQDFVTSRGLKGCEGDIKSAADKKPEFDATKEELQKLAEGKNYKAILEKMGITVRELPDGTWEISHYSSYFGDIALNDYSINENALLGNVSIIRGDANFKDSNATSLPKLREVGGKLDFKYAEISNLQGLESINGKKIEWNKDSKPEPPTDNDPNPPKPEPDRPIGNNPDSPKPETPQEPVRNEKIEEEMPENNAEGNKPLEINEEAQIIPETTKPAEKSQPQETHLEKGLAEAEQNSVMKDIQSYLEGYRLHGEDYVPENTDENTIFAEYYRYKEQIAKLQAERPVFNDLTGEQTPSKRDKKFPVIPQANTENAEIAILKDIQNFMLTESNLAKSEDYYKLVDETANLISQNPPKGMRSKMAARAGDIYRWKAICNEGKFFDSAKQQQAVKEYVDFVEELTGKKVLVGDSKQFSMFIDMLDIFKYPEAYENVDYIVVGHGKGSSMIADSSSPDAWTFKFNGKNVYEFIEENIPEGKKALVLTCEKDGKTLDERKTQSDMYDNSGNYMAGIGGVVNALAISREPAKICISGIRHIVGDVHQKREKRIVNGRQVGTYVVGVKTTMYDLDYSKYRFENSKNSIRHPMYGTEQEKISRNTTIEVKSNTKASEEEIYKAVNEIIDTYSKAAETIHDDLIRLGFDKLGEFSDRIKSESSLHDKIKNYFNDHPDAALEEAIEDVRDAYACRTVIKSVDLSTHQEILALLSAGDRKGAILKAAEIQSQPAVDMLKNMIQAQADGTCDYAITRLSNYVSRDGIPYFSEAQLADLKQFAASKGININFVERIKETDDAYDEVDETDYKPTTKPQPSGYTAFQMNMSTEDGKTIEWQFRGDKVNEFAEGEHLAYDLRTGKDIIGDNLKLTSLYSQFQKLLNKNVMPEDVYNSYNNYLNDYYVYLRKAELGFHTQKPKLSNYEINGYKFDKKLEAKNLIKLHKIADDLKDGKISEEKALELYECDMEKVDAIKRSYMKKHLEDDAVYDPDTGEKLIPIPNSLKAKLRKLPYTSTEYDYSEKNEENINLIIQESLDNPELYELKEFSFNPKFTVEGIREE